MDLNIDIEAITVLVLGAFAINCIYWAGRIVTGIQTRQVYRSRLGLN